MIESVLLSPKEQATLLNLGVLDKETGAPLVHPEMVSREEMNVNEGTGWIRKGERILAKEGYAIKATWGYSVLWFGSVLVSRAKRNGWKLTAVPISQMKRALGNGPRSPGREAIRATPRGSAAETLPNAGASSLYTQSPIFRLRPLLPAARPRNSARE